MSSVEGLPVIQYFADISGKSLDDGFVYIGTSGLDPVANPISVFWDAALTIPAPNPIRTRNGHPDRSGAPSRFFVNADSYSFSVRNKNGTVIYSALDSISASDIERRLRNTSNHAQGAGISGWLRAPLTDDFDNVAGFLDAQKVNIWEYAALVTSRPTPNDPNTWDWSPAIVAATTDLGTGDELYFPGGYTYISDTWTISNKTRVRVTMAGTLRRKTGTAGGVILNGVRNSKFDFQFIDGANESFTGLVDTGLDMQGDVVDNTIFIGRLTGYANGIRCRDTNGLGVYFNKISWNALRFVTTAITLTCSAGVVGFVNGNRFDGGHIRCSGSAFKSIKGTAQTDPFNGNTCYGLDIEAATDGYDLEFAKNNNILGGRFEGGGPVTGLWVKSTADCEGNTYVLNQIPLDKVQINEKAARIIADIMNTLVGVRYGQIMFSDRLGGLLHVMGFADTGSTVNTSNGVAVRNYLFNTDTGVTSIQDKGMTGLKIIDSAGTKRMLYRQDGQIDAINVSVDLPYGITTVRVATGTSAVDLRLKTADFYVGSNFMVEVTNFTNAIRIRNEDDTADLLAAGVINAVGMWYVYTVVGLGMRAHRLS